MTADTDALIRRIAVATATSEGFGPDQPDHEDVVGEYMSDSTFLAPAIAEEVRAASEKAFNELATQEPSEAEVLAVAKAIQGDGVYPNRPWDSLLPAQQASHCRTARRAILASRRVQSEEMQWE